MSDNDLQKIVDDFLRNMGNKDNDNKSLNNNVTGGQKQAEPITKEFLAGSIDHTILKPEATKEQIIQLCAEAKENHFASVCVNPYWVSVCAKELKGSDVSVCTVAGFPLGATSTVAKVEETKAAVKDGAHEVDMVLNIGELKAGNLTAVYEDIRSVVQVSEQAKIKVIIETCLLTNEEKVAACLLVKKAGADYVKTSTGFNKSGATIDDVQLMRQVVGPDMGVKAAGGIRDYETAVAMIRAGADRIGASASVAIVSF